MTKISYLLCVCFSLSLMSCSSLKPNISPTMDIVSRNIKTIKMEYWNAQDGDYETQEQFNRAFNNPSNWDTEIVVNDKSKIQKFITSLSTAPIENLKPGAGCCVPAKRLVFIDDTGNTFYTTIDISPGRKEVYLADSVYGEDVYLIVVEVFNLQFSEPDLVSDRKNWR